MGMRDRDTDTFDLMSWPLIGVCACERVVRLHRSSVDIYKVPDALVGVKRSGKGTSGGRWDFSNCASEASLLKSPPRRGSAPGGCPATMCAHTARNCVASGQREKLTVGSIVSPFRGLE